MKLHLFLILFITLGFGAYSQPSRMWATYYGGNNTRVMSVAYDSASSCTYIAGITSDTIGIATPGSHKDSIEIIYYGTLYTYTYPDAFIAKFDASGHRLWATYFGGDKAEMCANIQLDHAGNVYLTGRTSSTTGIASTNAFQPTLTNNTGGEFIAKFTPGGNLIWSTYYGINNNENSIGTGIMISPLVFDQQDNLYMCGGTGTNEGIATPGTYQDTINGQLNTQGAYIADGYICKFDSAGHRIWGTYYGGDSTDYFKDIYYDGMGSLYLVGITSSPSHIATTGTFIDTISYTGVGNYMVSFVVKMDTTGNRLWATYLCQSHAKIYGTSITGDEAGNIYILGETDSANILNTQGVFQSGINGPMDIFLLKLNKNNGTKIWNTFFGGSGVEELKWDYFGGGNSLCYNRQTHNLLLAGYTTSTDLPTTSCSYTSPENKKGLIALFDTTGNRVWSSYYDDGILDITNGEKDEFLFVTQTNINNLATDSAFLATKTTTNSGLLAKFSTNFICPKINLTLIQNGQTISLDTTVSSYTWYRNGIYITQTTGNTYTVPANDTAYYFATISDTCGCTYYSDTAYYNYNIPPDSTTNIANINNPFEVKLYPNPAINTLNISITTKIHSFLHWNIKDISGRLLQSGDINTNAQNQQNQSINIGNIAAGIYIISIGNETKQKAFLFTKRN